MGDVNGGVQGTSAYSASSDFRWKKGITKLQQSLQKLMNISGVSYQFRREEFPNKNFEDGHHFGFIAQHIELTFPEVVRTNAEGWKSVQYSAIVPILVEAVKEQERTIQAQESRARKQEAKIEKQEAKIEKQEAKIEKQQEDIMKLNTQMREQEEQLLDLRGITERLSRQIQAIAAQ